MHGYPLISKVASTWMVCSYIIPSGIFLLCSALSQKSFGKGYSSNIFVFGVDESPTDKALGLLKSVCYRDKTVTNFSKSLKKAFAGVEELLC